MASSTARTFRFQLDCRGDRPLLGAHAEPLILAQVGGKSGDVLDGPCIEPEIRIERALPPGFATGHAELRRGEPVPERLDRTEQLRMGEHDRAAVAFGKGDVHHRDPCAGGLGRPVPPAALDVHEDLAPRGKPGALGHPRRDPYLRVRVERGRSRLEDRVARAGRYQPQPEAAATVSSSTGEISTCAAVKRVEGRTNATSPPFRHRAEPLGVEPGGAGRVQRDVAHRGGRREGVRRSPR